MMTNGIKQLVDERWEPPFDTAIRSIAMETVSAAAIERIKSRAKAIGQIPNAQPNCDESTFALAKPFYRRPVLISMALTSAALFLMMINFVFLSFSTHNQAYAQMAVGMTKLQSFIYFVCQVDETKLNDLESIPKQKLAFFGPSFYRSTEESGIIQISDIATGQSILLDNQRKEARRFVIRNLTDERTPLAFVEKLRSHFLNDRKSVRELGKRFIAGKEVLGFQSELSGEVVEAWLDPQTNLPVEVRMRSPIRGDIPTGEQAVSWVVFNRFVYNVDFDDKLFAVTVPNGYREVRVMTSSVQALSDDFDRFATMLGICAEHNELVFPTSLKRTDEEGTCFAILAKYSIEWAARRDAAHSFEEQAKITVDQVEAVKKFASKIAAGLDFLKLPQDKLDFQYFKGARLNQINRPLAWFSPDGKETYKVLYADLTIRDVKAADLPQKPMEQAE